jgi:hypothetical protein
MCNGHYPTDAGFRSGVTVAVRLKLFEWVILFLQKRVINHKYYSAAYTPNGK